MIHLQADLDLVDLAILGAGGMIVFAIWVYLICRVVELFTQDWESLGF